MRARLRRSALLVGVVLLLGIGFGILKESREPYFALHLGDFLRPKPPPLEWPLPGELAGRLYGDTRPHTGKVARLQKGMVLSREGRELIEEGFGFGLPMAEVAGQAHLAQVATVSQAGDGVLVKRYTLDTIDTPSGFLRQKYVPVAPIGTVVVTYTVQSWGLDVDVDLSGIEGTWDRVYIMNEQGAGIFTQYQEPGQAAVDLPGDGRAQWESSEAPRGCLRATGPGEPISFCVETAPGLVKHYGRERYNQYYWVGMYGLSWAGIDIEVPAGVERLRYRIELDQGGA